MKLLETLTRKEFRMKMSAPGTFIDFPARESDILLIEDKINEIIKFLKDQNLEKPQCYHEKKECFCISEDCPFYKDCSNVEP